MVCPLQGYYPLEPEMLLFCCCFCLRCFLIVLKDFTLCSLLSSLYRYFATLSMTNYLWVNTYIFTFIYSALLVVLSNAKDLVLSL